MSVVTPYTHPLDANAVPMIGVNRRDFIERLKAEGWEVAMDGPSGIYFRDPHNERAMWVSWEFEHEGRSEWYTNIVKL